MFDAIRLNMCVRRFPASSTFKTHAERAERRKGPRDRENKTFHTRKH